MLNYNLFQNIDDYTFKYVYFWCFNKIRFTQNGD